MITGITNTNAPVIGSTHIATNAVLSPQRAPASQTTIESAAEPKGFCSSVRVFLKGLVDTVWGVVAGFFNTIKNCFTKQALTPVDVLDQALTAPLSVTPPEQEQDSTSAPSKGPQHLSAAPPAVTPFAQAQGSNLALSQGSQHLPAAYPAITRPVQTWGSTSNPSQGAILPKSLVQPFTIKISDRDIPPMFSLKEMRSKAREIGQQVSDGHIALSFQFPSCYGLERQRAMRFVEELRSVTDVIKTRRDNLFYIVPKKMKAEEIREGLTIRRYDNGVIEEVIASSEKITWENWEGRRVYPNGKIETGKFDKFRLHQGTYVEGGITSYRSPDTLVKSDSLDRSLIYADIEGKDRLIVIRKKPNTSQCAFDYIQVDEEPIPTLAKILQEKSHANIHLDFDAEKLNEVFSWFIDCKKFIQFLFDTNAFFSMNSYALVTLLKVLKKNGIPIKLPLQDPNTGKTLLDPYLGSQWTLKSLLTADPTLVRRIEGRESAFVRALLAGNRDVAHMLLVSMKKQGIPLLPRELLFEKVVFSEEEVTLEELESLFRKDQDIAYRLANIHSKLDAVRIMRTLGFGRSKELLMREGPSIFGCNMDALEMHERLKSFLTDLRSRELLLTRSEFNQFSEQNYIQKTRDVGRILGRDYIERKAHELKLEHVKVPKKLMVVDDQAYLNFQTSASLDLKPCFGGITVYAERIQSSNRKITPAEVSELLRLFEATGSSDITWSNIIVAEDGVYIINTEFANFWIPGLYFENGPQYAEMTKIIHALPEAQQQPLIDELNAKSSTYQQHEVELNAKRARRLEVERAALEKFGCLYGPHFTFSIDELSL